MIQDSTGKTIPKISIIVPVYKVEKYLGRCVKSILRQTFTDFELILVDDGSPDKCPQMCDGWVKKDKRIRVVHKENGGLSSARNAGLEAARGEYIGFVDSDDMIAEDMYEYLLQLLCKNQADFSAVEKVIFKTDKLKVKQPRVKEKVLDKKELFELFFRVTDENIHYCVWDKLFKRSVIAEIRFWEGMRFEDIDFMFSFLQNCSKGVFSNQVKYGWFYNDESITRNSLVKEDMQLLDVWGKIVSICKKRMPEYLYYAQMNYKRAYMGLLGKSVKFGVSNQYQSWNSDRKYLVKNLRKYFADLIKWRMPLSRKVLLCILCVSPSLLSFHFNRKAV
ncbi:MAG: glycosyltransferase [Lachnospiraceae bacterium]|nr:glycosyltransferase [Lachnospiraceae bacterium]